MCAMVPVGSIETKIVRRPSIWGWVVPLTPGEDIAVEPIMIIGRYDEYEYPHEKYRVIPKERADFVLAQLIRKGCPDYPYEFLAQRLVVSVENVHRIYSTEKEQKPLDTK